MRHLVSAHLKTQDIFNVYLHPFELSTLSLPDLPQETPTLTRWRCAYGRRAVESKVIRLIKLIKSHDYDFTTFSSLRDELRC